MDYTQTLHIAGKILQAIGLVLSSAAFLGPKRLAKLESASRRFRRLIKLRFFLIITKSLFSNVLLIVWGGAIIIYNPWPFFKAQPSAFDVFGPAGTWFMFFVFFMSTIIYLGMIYIAITSISKNNKLDDFANKVINYLSANWLNTIWWNDFSRSWVYKLFYYSLFLLVYILLISPLQTMQLISKRKNMKYLMQNRLEIYEQYFLPLRIRTMNVSRLKAMQRSLSWKNYSEVLPSLASKYFILLFPLKFPLYLFYIAVILELWLLYYGLFLNSILSAFSFGVLFFFLYIILWSIINFVSTIVSVSLYISLLPYRAIEILRIKADLQGGSILIMGFILGLIGILID